MPKITSLSLFAMIVLSSGPLMGTAQASSPAAWSAQDRTVAEACSKASGLKDAGASGKPMIFDDGVAITALLVSGRYPQPHMKNRAGRVLCLFDRKTNEAKVTPADQLRWSVPAKSGGK